MQNNPHKCGVQKYLFNWCLIKVIKMQNYGVLRSCSSVKTHPGLYRTLAILKPWAKSCMFCFHKRCGITLYRVLSDKQRSLYFNVSLIMSQSLLGMATRFRTAIIVCNFYRQIQRNSVTDHYTLNKALPCEFSIFSDMCHSVYL